MIRKSHHELTAMTFCSWDVSVHLDLDGGWRCPCLMQMQTRHSPPTFIFLCASISSITKVRITVPVCLVGETQWGILIPELLNPKFQLWTWNDFSPSITRLLLGLGVFLTNLHSIVLALTWTHHPIWITFDGEKKKFKKQRGGGIFCECCNLRGMQKQHDPILATPALQSILTTVTQETLHF